jgi:hypothetical protein
VQLDFIRDDRALVRRLDDQICAVLGPAIERAFTDHTPVLATFIVKHPGPDSAFYLHRDIAVNDHRSTRCFTLWIPLVAVDAERENGGLGVIPGSHRLATGEHGFDASVLIAPFESILLDHLEPMTIAAGDALVYDSRLLHASPPNLGPVARPAIGCLLARRSEPLVHVVPTGRRHRRVHRIDRDFFIDHHPADVAQQEMPSAYPVIDEYDEEAVVEGADLARVLGLAEPPVARTLVPDDVVRDHGIGPGSLPSRPTRLVLGRRDLDIGAGDLDPAGSTVGPASVVGQVGAWGARDLVRAGRRTRRAPAGLPDLRTLLTRPATREATLIAMARGSRLRLQLRPQRRAVDEVVGLDGPQVRAGLGVTGRAIDLRPGWRVPVPDDEPVTLWNDGPGTTLVLLRRAWRPPGPTARR